MIPRWVRNGASPVVGGQMHVFGDASRTAYAAVVCLRFLRRDGSHSSHFITSKNRVAPLKTTSIPRIDLLAALLTVRLSEYVRRTLALENWPLFFWTDSTIALAWVTGPKHRLQPWVKNIATETHSQTNKAIWEHCPGHWNPADLASRGISASHLAQSSSATDHSSSFNQRAIGQELFPKRHVCRI